MEDFYLHEDILMLDAGPNRRNRVRRDHFTHLSDFKFVAHTRFSKDGVERLAARLAYRGDMKLSVMCNPLNIGSEPLPASWSLGWQHSHLNHA